MRKIFFKESDDGDNNSWMSFTDMMSGLVILFIVVSAILYGMFSRTSHINEEFGKTIPQLRAERDSLLTDIARLKASDLKNLITQYQDVFITYDDLPIIANIDTVRGSIALYSKTKGQGIFPSDQSSIESNPNLGKYLNRIRKPFLEKSMSLWKARNLYNMEIRIEGHTDPAPYQGWEDTGFEDNLNLSMWRANSVYCFFLNHKQNTPEELDYIMKNMISVGYSYSRCLNEGNLNNKDEYYRYRTIEFRIISK